jgi:hypothetical protein
MCSFYSEILGRKRREYAMRVSAAGLIAVVCGVCIAACTPLPKSFKPHTPEEQAVVRTIDAFLSAWRARDAERLTPLVLPEATIEAFADGGRVPPARILALPQRAADAALLRVTANRLVDFHQDAPNRVSVGAYVHDIVDVARGSDQVTTRIKWDLVRDNGAWRIQHITQTTCVHPLDIRGFCG